MPLLLLPNPNQTSKTHEPRDSTTAVHRISGSPTRGLGDSTTAAHRSTDQPPAKLKSVAADLIDLRQKGWWRRQLVLSSYHRGIGDEDPCAFWVLIKRDVKCGHPYYEWTRSRTRQCLLGMRWDIRGRRGSKWWRLRRRALRMMMMPLEERLLLAPRLGEGNDLVALSKTQLAHARLEAGQHQNEDVELNLVELTKKWDSQVAKLQAKTKRLSSIRSQAAPIDSRILKEKA
ncbi:uncharacterized protein A4U43_C08F24970 [Asparagus officinalis]|nr:uncharacterized protein A4U43_C08F24970 [Asparagus officinalis]